jgi:hypothetical protein
LDALTRHLGTVSYLSGFALLRPCLRRRFCGVRSHRNPVWSKYSNGLTGKRHKVDVTAGAGLTISTYITYIKDTGNVPSQEDLAA